MPPPAREALIANVAGAVAVALAVDGGIAALGWGAASDATARPGDPPGLVVGAVWVVLFGCLGAARALVLAVGRTDGRRLARGVAALVAFCAVYPAYTAGLAEPRLAEAGNVATLAAATWLALRLRRTVPRAAALVVPTVLWVAFATSLTTRDLFLHHATPV